MRRFFVLAVGLVLIYSVSSAQDIRVSARIIDVQEPSITLPPELDRVLRDYERHWKAGNGTALSELFTEDGFIARGPWIRGRDAIRTAYSTSSGGDLRLRTLAYATSDTVGYIVGGFRYGEATTDGGKFILALRRAPRGDWKIAADLDASNRQ